jgi:hypothetical protein
MQSTFPSILSILIYYSSYSKEQCDNVLLSTPSPTFSQTALFTHATSFSTLSTLLFPSSSPTRISGQQLTPHHRGRELRISWILNKTSVIANQRGPTRRMDVLRPFFVSPLFTTLHPNKIPSPNKSQAPPTIAALPSPSLPSRHHRYLFHHCPPLFMTIRPPS